MDGSILPATAEGHYDAAFREMRHGDDLVAAARFRRASNLYADAGQIFLSVHAMRYATMCEQLPIAPADKVIA